MAFVAVAALATNLWAIGEARYTGKVVDENKKPLQGVTVTATSTGGKNVKMTAKTDKDGKFALFLIDGTLTYKFTFAKEGYSGYETTLKLKLVPEKNEDMVTMVTGGAASEAPPPGAKVVPAKVDPAVAAFNEGADLANNGKDAEAIAKFEEAVTLKPELTAGYIALTKLYARTSNWKMVIDRGNKVLEISPDETDVIAAMATAYEKTGDKAKAAEFKAKVPKDASAVFNEAAALINKGKTGEAEPLLKQAIQIDPSFAEAYYELGMLYAGQSKNTLAKENLNKYLELAPDGRNASTAKEMINYMK
jgi:tetratricopeptide (TPR) repeat protein